MIETRLGAANALATNAHEQYVYGQGYVDDVVLRDAEVNGGGNLGITGSGLDQRLYYQQDREFNVVALVDQGGAVVERYAYDPYGSVSALDANWNILNSGSAYGNQVGFTGRWLDDTGMWYFRARYEEPVLGRFISRDPWRFVDGMNVYTTYFVSFGVDPYGLSAQEMQAVYDVLMKKCNNPDCACHAHGDDCKKEATQIAQAYVNTFHSHARDVPDQGERHLGWLCYEWSTFVEQALRGMNLKIWSINAVQKASHARHLTQGGMQDIWMGVHNYVVVSSGPPNGPNGPDKKCSVILDPWWTKQPLAIDMSTNANPIYDWTILKNPNNWQGPGKDPQTGNSTPVTSAGWTGTQWIPVTPTVGQGGPENSDGARGSTDPMNQNPDGSVFSPPAPVTDWSPQ